MKANRSSWVNLTHTVRGEREGMCKKLDNWWRKTWGMAVEIILQGAVYKRIGEAANKVQYSSYLLSINSTSILNPDC